MMRTAARSPNTAKRGAEIVGMIPYDPVVTEAMVAGVPVVEFSGRSVSDTIKDIWRRVSEDHDGL